MSVWAGQATADPACTHAADIRPCMSGTLHVEVCGLGILHTADLAYTQACSMEPSNFSVYHLLIGEPPGSGDVQMMIQQQRWESGTVVSSRMRGPRS